MEKKKFADLGLSPEVLRAIDRLGFEEATPIQTAALPPSMAGRDLVGQSATGSGKTAAFAIPLIERVDVQQRCPQALILCPTRELAVQVAEEVATLGAFKRGLHAVPIYGGQSYDRQCRALAAGAQIVIGTPGRVIDLLERGNLKLDGIRMAVLDEADRMLDLGFREDIERLLGALPAERQLLFYSATLPPPIQAIIRTHLRDPERIRIEPKAQGASTVEQVYYEIDRRSKIEALTRILDRHDYRYGIIFCSTKVMVDDLHEHLLARGYATDRLHGDITQHQRDRTMQRFKRRAFEFLIATDVAARGIDVDDLEVVINYDVPNDAEDYTHRIGRTGRAGRSGRALTFVSGSEIYRLQTIIRHTRMTIRRERVPSLDEIEEVRENALMERVRRLLDSGAFARRDRMVDRLLEQGYAPTDITCALLHLLQGGKEPEEASAPRSPKAEDAKDSPTEPQESPAPAKPKPKAKATRVEHEAPFRDDVPEDEGADEPMAPITPENCRTGKEQGMVTLQFNLGTKVQMTVGELVGKIAGVTRLPSNVIGVIDLGENYSLVDVRKEHAAKVLLKMKGVRMKNRAVRVRPYEPPV